jgi:hypothetical protein
MIPPVAPIVQLITVMRRERIPGTATRDDPEGPIEIPQVHDLTVGRPDERLERIREEIGGHVDRHAVSRIGKRPTIQVQERIEQATPPIAARG